MKSEGQTRQADVDGAGGSSQAHFPHAAGVKKNNRGTVKPSKTFKYHYDEIFTSCCAALTNTRVDQTKREKQQQMDEIIFNRQHKSWIRCTLNVSALRAKCYGCNAKQLDWLACLATSQQAGGAGLWQLSLRCLWLWFGTFKIKVDWLICGSWTQSVYVPTSLGLRELQRVHVAQSMLDPKREWSADECRYFICIMYTCKFRLQAKYCIWN